MDFYTVAHASLGTSISFSPIPAIKQIYRMIDRGDTHANGTFEFGITPQLYCGIAGHQQQKGCAMDGMFLKNLPFEVHADMKTMVVIAGRTKQPILPNHMAFISVVITLK